MQPSSLMAKQAWVWDTATEKLRSNVAASGSGKTYTMGTGQWVSEGSTEEGIVPKAGCASAQGGLEGSGR